MITTNENKNDLQDLADNARDLLDATADQAGEKVAAARKRLSEALEKGREAFSMAQERAVEGAKVTDKMIRENPYPAMAIAFGLGAVLGIVLSRGSK